jgi:hypothetical protein
MCAGRSRLLVALGAGLWVLCAMTCDFAVAAARECVVLISQGVMVKSTLLAVEGNLNEIAVPLVVQISSDSQLRSRHLLQELATDHSALGVIWLEQRAGGVTHVYVFDARRSKLGMRRLVLDAEPATRDESVAIAVRSTIEALIEGKDPELEAVEPLATPASEPSGQAFAPQRSAPGLRRLALRGGYVGSALSSESLQHGLGLALTFRLDTLQLGLGYSILAPATLRAGGVVVRVTRRPIDLMAGAMFEGSLVDASAWLGLTLEQRDRSSEVTMPGLRAEPAASYWVTALLLKGALSRSIAPRLHGEFAAALEIGLNEPEYVVRGTTSTTVPSFGMRPRIEAGVRVEVW